MCGIYLYISASPITGRSIKQHVHMASKIKHRGPDDTRTMVFSHAVAVFHRLQIVDPHPEGMQPFIQKVAPASMDPFEDEWVCMVNGEIYNHMQLREKIAEEYKPKSHSDCEVVLSLFLTYRQIASVNEAVTRLNNDLDGEYAIVLYNTTYNYGIAITDELRIRPLFMSYHGSPCTEFTIASEQKACGRNAIPLLAGSAYYFGNTHVINGQKEFRARSIDGKLFPLFQVSFDSHRALNLRLRVRPVLPGVRTPPLMSFDDAAETLRKLLVDNIHNKLHPERNYGFLLSGGIDSSLVCGVAARYCSEHGLPRIRTFTVGFSAEAPDIIAARIVARHIDSIHSEIIVPYQVGIDLVPHVVRAIESWDQTSVRASIPMMIAAQYIKKHHPEIAVIYSGEVADELLRGYLYNRKQMSPEEIRDDMEKRLYDISMFDGLRADRVIASVGMELRLPFFSKALIKFALELPWEYLDPTANGGVEKALLRKAFVGQGYIPDEIVNRTKNAFSDATSVMVVGKTVGGNTVGSEVVGSEWKEMLKRAAEQNVTEQRFALRRDIYHSEWIHTREDMWYYDLYNACKYNPNAIPYKWLPSWVEATDSSATTLSVFSATDLK